MNRMFDCPHCGVTTAIPEGMYLDSDDCDSCGRNYWETPLPEEEEMPEDSLEDMEFQSVLNAVTKRYEEYDQLSLRELQTMNLDFTRQIHLVLIEIKVHMRRLVDASLVQLDVQQFEKFQDLNTQRYVSSNFDNLPTTKENK